MVKTIRNMDIIISIDFGHNQVLQDGINDGSRPEQNLDADIKREPNLELNIKQETNLEPTVADIKQETIPVLKQFAFIDANNQDTSKTMTHSSLKIAEAYTLIDTEETSPSYMNSEVNEQKQRNELTILKQEPDHSEVRESTTGKVLVERESETRTVQNPPLLKATAADAFEHCEYFCRICSEEFYTELKLTRHLMGVHKETPLKYRKKFGPLQTKVVFHKCGLCGEKVRHSRNEIYKHLKQSPKHKSGDMSLSLDTYHKRYMGGGQWYNQSWFDCRKCPEKSIVKSDLVSHIQRKHGFKLIMMFFNCPPPFRCSRTVDS